jgi:release factor glutamine methyltransferase
VRSSSNCDGNGVVTVRELVASARSKLERAGIATHEAGLDAELLARHVLGWERATWVMRQHEEASPEFDDAFSDLVARRVRREPVAYIRARQEFFGREFLVTPAVLIPRPETELLIEEALLLLPALGFSRSLTVIDIGTGSGCLAVTLALEYPNARYIATDSSEAALSVARLNARQHGVFEQIDFVRGAYFAGRNGPFNLVITNPPYVADAERPALAPEVADYEPASALFGGEDGLRYIGAIIAQTSAVMDNDGSLVMEIGHRHRDRVADLAAATADLALVRTRADLQGIPRVAVIRRCR